MVLFVAILSLLPLVALSASPSLYIVIRSQPNSYHDMKAQALQKNIETQVEEIGADVSVVQVNKKWADDYDRAWAILPMMPDLADSYTDKDWIMFIEDGTEVKIGKLLEVLEKYDSKKDQFLARALFDTDMVIIHHFSSRKAKEGGPFLFPDFEAGWVLNSALVKKIGDDWRQQEPGQDFQIDLKYEIAVYIAEKFNVEITKVKEFCGAGEESPNCATIVHKSLPVCEDKNSLDDIFVAVKTTLMFHKDRVKVVMDTWGPKVKHMVLYSNFTDPSIPTVDCGVPNTVRGHCGKTDAILKDFVKRAKVKQYKWLIIADDDTIMSVARMMELLSCYDYKEKTFLGEKYGFSLTTGYGYAYITGGGSMVFSKPAAEAWVGECGCPSNDTPDDMILGSCLHQRARIIATHSPLFHQGRPSDYAEGYLSNQTPVSFHKHWMVDPIKVYKDWFEEADSVLETYDHAAPKITVTPTSAPEMVATPLPPTPLENSLKDEL